MITFDELKVSKSLLKALREAAIDTPTDIQAQAIPKINAGMDVIGIAQTGTGKTFAYLLPILSRLVKAEGYNPRALVLVPTRELAMQVKEACDSLTLYSNLRSLAAYGGIGITKQMEEIDQQEGVDLVIATPGRLWDLYRSNKLPLKSIRTLVFDEADRMLDMGFIPQIRQLLEVIPPRRQNLLFSATFSEKVDRMVAEFLAFPERVEVSPSATPARLVEQRLYTVPNLRTKLNFLDRLLDQPDFNRVMVFCRTKENAESVFGFLQHREKGEVRVMHSNKGQTTRINAMNAFKRGELRVLVSTDVAARGIDVNKVSHVVNFDVPILYEDYVHRIGRTGRVNETGIAITFVTPPDIYHLKRIEEMMQTPLSIEPLPSGIARADFLVGEEKQMAREVDLQRRRDDPEYQGAFHERKSKTEAKTEKKNKTSKKGNTHRGRHR